jgi:twitching motility protein PilT
LRGVVAQILFPRADGQGRVACYEVLRNTKPIANLIRENKIHQIPSVIQTSSKQGMFLFEKSAEELVRKGIVSSKEIQMFLGKEKEESSIKIADTEKKTG